MPPVQTRRIIITLGAAAALGGLVAAAASSLGGVIPGPLPIFPRDNWWNLDISTPPIEPSSASYIAFVIFTSCTRIGSVCERYLRHALEQRRAEPRVPRAEGE